MGRSLLPHPSSLMLSHPSSRLLSIMTTSLADMILGNRKRTCDLYTAEMTSGTTPPFLPAQKLKVAVKVDQEYKIPRSSPTVHTSSTKQESEATSAPGNEETRQRGPSVLAGQGKAKGEATDTLNILNSLRNEEAERELRQYKGKYGGSRAASRGALVAYKGNDAGGAMVSRSNKRDGRTPPGAAAAAAAGIGNSSALALHRTPAKVPTPTWHAPWKLHAVVAGHLGWVRAVAFDPANEWFVTGSADRTIKVWDLAKCAAGAEGGLRLTLTGHISAVRALAVSNRHPYLFSVAEDKTVKCWDLEQNKVIRHYHGHLSGVYSLALHPTLDVLVTGGRDSVARVWDMRTKMQVHVLGGHTNTVGALATNSVDPQIITGSYDSTIKLWNIVAGKSMATLTNHKKAVRDLKVHPKELSFVSGAQDNLKKWQVRDGKFLKNLSGHNAVINTLAINEDNVLVSCGDNGSLRFWDYQTGYCFQRLETIVQPGSLDCEAGIYASAFDMSGTRFLTCEADKTVKIWKEDAEASPETHPIDMEAWKQECLSHKRW